jgi:hypothetical protein
MPQPRRSKSVYSEGKLLLALQAFKNGQFRSLRSAANTYNVPNRTLDGRYKGKPARQDCVPTNRKLTPSEESVIIQHILDLDSRGFPPRFTAVEEMANLLLADRGATQVGKKWASNFVKRRPEIKPMFNRKHDYKRLLCQDPEAINGWFRLVRNFMSKYGIVEEDIYNFDESGFLMGVIGTAKVVTGAESRNRPKQAQPGNREWVTVIQGVNSQGWIIPPFIILSGQNHLSSWYEDDDLPSDWAIAVSENGWTTNELGFAWIQHFEKHTKGRTVGSCRLLILDGHESHVSAQFEQFCKENKIITLCMPAHSSHILQPLDVGCFGPLKTAYGRQIENYMRRYINHFTKLEFLPAFKEAWKVTFTKENICSGFRGAGLVPYDPEHVISKLDIRLLTPPPPPLASEPSPWQSKTPSNPRELQSQTDLIKSSITGQLDSSPTRINEAIDQLVKCATTFMHTAVLLRQEVKELQAANAMKKQRQKRRKKRIQEAGVLTVREGQDIIQNAAVEEQIRMEIQKPQGAKRRCRKCGGAGHNVRTCIKHQESNAE